MKAPPFSPQGNAQEVGETISAGLYGTPDADNVLFPAKPCDPFVGAIGMLEVVRPSDLAAFAHPTIGLGQKVRPD